MEHVIALKVFHIDKDPLVKKKVIASTVSTTSFLHLFFHSPFKHYTWFQPSQRGKSEWVEEECFQLLCLHWVTKPAKECSWHISTDCQELDMLKRCRTCKLFLQFSFKCWGSALRASMNQFLTGQIHLHSGRENKTVCNAPISYLSISFTTCFTLPGIV